MSTMIRVPKNRNVKRAVCKALLILLLAVVLVVVLYPLLFVIATSFKTYPELVTSPFSITFRHPENFVTAWTEGNFGGSLINSSLVTLLAVFAQVVTSALAIFAIGVLRFRGSAVFVGIFLFTMFLSGEMLMIPNLILVRELGLFDTLGALLFPAGLSVSGMGIFMGINFIRATPAELREAAAIDGATIPQVFWHIDFVMMRPVLAFIAVGAFSGTWADFFWPLISLPLNESAYTMPLALMKFESQNNTLYGVLCAGMCFMALPVVVVYSFLSKYFIEGVAVGAVKG